MRQIFKHPYRVVVMLIILGMAIPVIAKSKCEWDYTYFTAARRLLTGKPLYLPRGPFVYPPFSALMSIPFAVLPMRLGRVVWYFGALATSLIYFLIKSWRLSGGGSLDLPATPEDGKQHIILWLGCAAAMPYVGNALAHVQSDVLIAALVFAGIAAAVAGRYLLAAVWFGLGAAFKGPPLLFAVYLLIRRKYLDCLLMIGVCIGCNLAPNLISAPAGGGLWLTQWVQRYVVPLSAPNRAPGTWYAAMTDNQSLAGAANRFFLTIPVQRAKGFGIERRANPISTAELKSIVYAGQAILFLTVISAIWIVRRKAGEEDAAQVTIIECGLILLLIPLLSPMSGRAHFATLLLPAFCLARAAVLRKDRTAMALLILSIIAAIISFNTFFVPKVVVMWSLWLGVVTWEDLLLLIGLLWLLAILRKPESVDARTRPGQNLLAVVAQQAVPTPK